MSDWPAKRGQTQAGEYGKDFQEIAGFWGMLW